MQILDAAATEAALPWPALLAGLADTLADARAGGSRCPPRSAVPLAGSDVWLLMPAWSHGADVAVCKLITVHAGNPARGLPSILGDLYVIRASTGERLALLDGPTVTGRRTAAVTALALDTLLRQRPVAAPAADEPLECLIIGCGVQGASHLDALASVLPITRFHLQSRSRASAERLAARARDAGRTVTIVGDADAAGSGASAGRPAAATALRAALDRCRLVVCCTPALEICLAEPPRADALVAAIGAFTPTMAEIAPAVVRGFGRSIVLDTPDARHEAGDLAVAGVDTAGLPTLLDADWAARLPAAGPVLFKSCGSALWDLAAAGVVAAAAGPATAR
ncbi:MAG: delta(1)-pyrroline-2-carboxylate reductase family protein [Lautropia sp.]